MPPLARCDVRNLVRKLGADARPSQQRAALATIAGLSTACDGDRDSLRVIGAAGAIPPLVLLLGPGSSDPVHTCASAALANLAYAAENAAIVAAAGAIPPLVLMLGPGSSAVIQKNAAAALGNLAMNAESSVIIAAAGAIPPLVQLLGRGSAAEVQQQAAGAHWSLADIPENQVAIATAGGIPPLVQLLGSLPRNAAGALLRLAMNADNRVAIAVAGAVPPLVRLLGAGSPAPFQQNAAVALGNLAQNADNAVTIAAAGAIPALQAVDDAEHQQVPVPYTDVGFDDIAKEFFVLGWIGFGGPQAHIGLFQRRLVQAKRWMSDDLFLELFALGGALPGPTSTEVSFAMGAVKKGVLGGLLSGILFQYPGALIMSCLGIGSAYLLKDPPAWLLGCVAGVSAVGVALVASAAKGLLYKIVGGKERDESNFLLALTVASAAAAFYWTTNPWIFPILLVLGGVVTAFANRSKDMTMKGHDAENEKIAHLGISRTGGAIMMVVWVALLVSVIFLVHHLDYDHRRDANALDWFEVFFRTGSLVHGGGQAVLPMLLSDIVKTKCDYSVVPAACVDDLETSWLTTTQFYTGLGLAQAMPGPLFNFSAYLGAIIAINAGYSAFIGIACAWFGLFSPGIILMFACLPFWAKFRQWQAYRRALPGITCASTGLILASVFRMGLDVFGMSAFPKATLCIGLAAFIAVDAYCLFEGAVVVGGIALGYLGYIAHLT
ncbi:hypothetical protein FOA52_015016 [Chlamydomonas sp. UWO 241]|nr:hypothetical protein FOA52_015016 [Chlamydomonas sp. UWO 241]